MSITKTWPEMLNFKEQLKGILMVVTFNSAYFQNIHYLREYYRKWFPDRNILVLGPTTTDEKQMRLAKEFGVISIDKPYTPSKAHEGTKMRNNYDFYLYRQEAQIIKDNPGFEGYLFASDDAPVLLPYWAHYDFSKSALLPFRNSSSITKLQHAEVLGLNVFFQHIITDPRWDQMALYEPTPDTYMAWTNADVYYIVKRDVESYLSYTDFVGEHMLHLEFAVTSWFFFVLPGSHRATITMGGCYTSAQDIIRSRSKIISKDCGSLIGDRPSHYLHPIKFGLDFERNTGLVSNKVLTGVRKWACEDIPDMILSMSQITEMDAMFTTRRKKHPQHNRSFAALIT